MATVPRASGALPVAGARMRAAPITDQINYILAFIEAQNIDENNVDLTASDGIVGKSTAQTITGQKTFAATTLFSATWDVPIRIGVIRMWDDTTTGCIRVKRGSDPSSITDGKILLETE